MAWSNSPPCFSLTSPTKTIAAAVIWHGGLQPNSAEAAVQRRRQHVSYDQQPWASILERVCRPCLKMRVRGPWPDRSATADGCSGGIYRKRTCTGVTACRPRIPTRRSAWLSVQRCEPLALNLPIGSLQATDNFSDTDVRAAERDRLCMLACRVQGSWPWYVHT
jgi:hypothetical protein